MLENKETIKTNISELGEFNLIKRLTEEFPIKQTSTIQGIGDDAAVLKTTDNVQVITTDMLSENVHFNLLYTPLKHLGYKSVVVNLSDIYAMNATPTQILVSIAVSNKYPVEALDQIYEGIRTACAIYNVDLVGGDTTTTPQGLVISVTAIGEAKEEEICYRNTAKDNDLLVVSGDLGAAYMGLLVLEREKVTYESNPNFQPDLENYQYILEKQLKPEARKDVILKLKELGIKPTSMIDLSDGLGSEAKHLSEQSNIGFHIYETKIPIDPSVMAVCQEFNINPTTAALNGGEDYELLFTITQEDFQKIEHSQDFTVIGFATEKSDKPYLITSGTEQLVEITAQGWDSFTE